MKDTDPVEPPVEPPVDADARLVRAILGETPRLNAEEAVDGTGISLDQARRLWRALGFPENPARHAYTEADTSALTQLAQIIEPGTIDLDLAVSMTRALGQTMARLADWEVGSVRQRAEDLALQRSRQAGESVDDSRQDVAIRMLEELGAGFEQLMLYAWRRHLAAAVARIQAVDDAQTGADSTRLSVGFADIVRFTALSNQISRERIGDLVELFESRCSDVVAAQDGRVIKSIGDSVLFVNVDPVRAYDTAEGIIQVVGRDPRMPDVRLGLAHGSVVMRMGDVFGPPVNLASRLTAVARRNRIIIDAAIAELLPGDEFETRRLPARPVRGFGVIEPLTVRRH